MRNSIFCLFSRANEAVSLDNVIVGKSSRWSFIIIDLSSCTVCIFAADEACHDLFEINCECNLENWICSRSIGCGFSQREIERKDVAGSGEVMVVDGPHQFSLQ